MLRYPQKHWNFQNIPKARTASYAVTNHLVCSIPEKHIALCLEDLNASHHDERFVQCVALYGREPGLCLDGQGCPLWQTKTDAVCELWRSADGRLVLWKLPNTSSIIVRRASRVLEVPPEKPLILLDKDEIDVGSKTLRVHLHGTTSRIGCSTAAVTRRNETLFELRRRPWPSARRLWLRQPVPAQNRLGSRCENTLPRPSHA